jgi:succinate dehydrogenase / fumarate reductase cytochrome b subunit
MAGSGLASIVEVTRYRGRFGQLDWVLRRLAGLGVLLFLLVHVVDTATVYFAPPAYAWFINLYRSPIFGLGEIALGGGVIYHAMSGLCIVILDLFPALWRYRPQARLVVWALFLAGFVPLAAWMFVRLVEHNLLR